MAAALGLAALTLTSAVSAGSPMPRANTELGVDGYFSSLLVGIHKTRLASGLRVVLQRDTSWPLVAVNVTFDAGRDLEGTDAPLLPERARSLRHRHLEPASRPDYALAAARGSRSSHHFGWAHTSFTQVLPASELPFALWLEARRLSALKHGDGVQEGPTAEDRQGLLLLEPRHGALLRLERQILGRRSVELTAWQRLSRYFFSAEHAVLTLAGDFDPDQATHLIREYFEQGIAPDSPDAGSAAPPAPPPAKARRHSLSEPSTGPAAVAVGYATPALAHADHAALELASYIVLGSINASRNELRTGLRAREFAAGLSHAGEHGLFWVYARVDQQRTEDARAALLSRVRLLTTQPSTSAALERAKQAALVDWLSHFVSLERRAALLGRYEALHGDARLATRRHSSLRAVTSDQLLRAARRHLVADQATVLTLERTRTSGEAL